MTAPLCGGLKNLTRLDRKG